MKDKNGVEWIDGKHKESLFDGISRQTEVIKAFGKEWLVMNINGHFTAWSEADTAEMIEFVEPSETVDDIRAELADHHMLPRFTRLFIDQIIDRVVKAMEDDNK